MFSVFFTFLDLTWIMTSDRMIMNFCVLQVELSAEPTVFFSFSTNEL